MALKSEKEIATENGIDWHTLANYSSKKDNRGSMPTGRKYNTIVRSGNGCLNRETPGKSARFGRYVITEKDNTLIFYLM